MGVQMTWIESAGDVSDWMISVATALPHPRKEPPPYTLGEGVSEIGAYADSVHPKDWPKTNAVKTNRESLHRELDAQRSFLGPRMGARVDVPFAAVRHEADRKSTVRAAAAFDTVWTSDAAKLDAFDDLCDAAKEPGATTGRLRQLARVIASQLGAEATSFSSPLRDAANALAASDEELSHWGHISIQRALDEAERLRLARESLTTVGVGRVVVWLAYRRAMVWGMRTAIGPVTLLRPEVALVHAFEDGVQDFPERAELREIRERVHWLDDLHKHSLDTDSHYALARVDLGERPTAGAAEEARRLIDAILGIPVTDGGVSWDDTGAVAVIHNGRIRMLSKGLINSRTDFDDTFGIGATAEILNETSEQLGLALSNGPMPDHLIEALSALREAGMTEHRDVHFYGARPVTPRFATALEDHAIELIASLMGVASKDLALTLEHHYALRLADRQALTQLIAPFDKNWGIEDYAHRRELEDSVSHPERGGELIVEIVKVVASQEAIRSLRMTALQRADFEDALRMCTDTSHEQRLLTWAQKESELLRDRHRRVRNAVNHGLPLAPTTLSSVREYATSTSRVALNLALTWYINDESGAALIEQENAHWVDRLAMIAGGDSWALRLDEQG